MTGVTGAVALLASFAAMEAVSYAAHRWVMHGAGWAWHRSHHLPPQGALERNDLFPVCFSALGSGLFVAAAAGVAPVLWWVAAGVTAYGAAYLAVHEVYIHRRLPVPAPRLAYLAWLRDAHRDHHVGGGEPYGMLFPVVRGPVRDRRPAADPLDRASTRSARARL